MCPRSDPVGTGKVIEKAGLIQGLTLLEKHGLAQMDWAASGLVDSFFHVFDKNASGSIDLKEFCIGVAMLTKGSLKDKIRCACHLLLWALRYLYCVGTQSSMWQLV